MNQEDFNELCKDVSQIHFVLNAILQKQYNDILNDDNDRSLISQIISNLGPLQIDVKSIQIDEAQQEKSYILFKEDNVFVLRWQNEAYYLYDQQLDAPQKMESNLKNFFNEQMYHQIYKVSGDLDMLKDIVNFENKQYLTTSGDENNFISQDSKLEIVKYQGIISEDERTFRQELAQKLMSQNFKHNIDLIQFVFNFCVEQKQYKVLKKVIKFTINELVRNNQNQLNFTYYKIDAKKIATLVQSPQYDKVEKKKPISKHLVHPGPFAMSDENHIIMINEMAMEALRLHLEKIAIGLVLFSYHCYKEDFITSKTLHFAVHQKTFLFIKLYYEMYPLSLRRLESLTCIAQIIKLFDNPLHLIHGIYLLFKCKPYLFNQMHLRILLEKFELLAERNLYYFSYCNNPILLLVMIVEFCLQCIPFQMQIRIQLEQMANKYRDIAANFKTFFCDELLLKTIFLKRMYPSPMKPLNQILFERRDYYILLVQDSSLLEAIDDLWVCPYYYEKNLFKYVSAFCNTSGPLVFQRQNNFQKKRQHKQSTKSDLYEQLSNAQESIRLQKRLDLIDNFDLMRPYKFFEPNNINQLDYRTKNSTFSYFFYVNSPSFRTTMDCLIYILFFILVLENNIKIMECYQGFMSFSYEILIYIDGLIGLAAGYSLNSFPELQEKLKMFAYYKKFTSQTQVFAAINAAFDPNDYCKILKLFVPSFAQCDLYNYLKANTWELCFKFERLQIYFFTGFVYTIGQTIYNYKKQRKLMMNFMAISDIIVAVLNVFIITFFEMQVVPKKAILYDKMLSNMNFLIKACIVFQVLMWVKLLAYLKLTHRFGAMIKVIELMIVELITFMILFGTIILGFATTMTYILQDKSMNYSNIFYSIRELFLITYGAIKFDVLDGREEIGSLIITVFSLASLIILMNLLIAQLSNTYALIQRNSKLEQASILYETYRIKRVDRYYSSLIVFPAPLNVLTVAFIPFVLALKNKQLNLFLVTTGYLIVYGGVLFPIYVLLSLFVAIPIAYFKLLAIIMINCVITGEAKIFGVLYFFEVLFTGYFYFAYHFFKNDIKIFVKSCWREIRLGERLDEITIEEISIIKKQIKKSIDQGIKYMTYEEIYSQCYQQLKQTSIQQRAQQMKGIANRNQILSKQISSSGDGPQDQAKRNLERKLLQNVDLDVIETSQLLRQFQGIQNKIDLTKAYLQFNMIQFNMKFNMDLNNRWKALDLVNTVQICDNVTFERAIFTQLRIRQTSEKNYEDVIQSRLYKSFQNFLPGFNKIEDGKLIKKEDQKDLNLLNQMMQASIIPQK